MSAEFNLEKAVGRLLVGRIAGSKVDEQTEGLLRSGTAGGICIFKDNVESLESLSVMVETINSLSPFNPIICVDQEGGAVQRFDDVLSPLPSLMALAATGSETHAETAAVINGRQLRLLGVNCVLSPVVDVASNPLNPIIGTRAFSSNPQTVSRLAKAMVEAFMQEGVVPVIKHFPGHGDTSQDSHSELAVINRSRQSIEQLELVPFKECADIAPAVLAAHVWLSAYEEKPLPATLSHKLLNDVLRQDLKFDGVIFTDDMMMKAVSDRYGLSESALLAIEAGCDVVLLCSTPEQLREAHTYIVDAVKSGRLSEKRILDANERIEKLFPPGKKRNSANKVQLPLLQETIGEDTHRISVVYKDSICVLKGALPVIDENPLLVISPKHPRYELPLAHYLKEELLLKGAKPNIESIIYTVDPDQGEIEKLVETARGKNVALVTFRSGLNKGQIELAEKLEKAASNFFGVAADIPYDALSVSPSASYLCTFDPSNMAMEELAILLVHNLDAKGICPVMMNAEIKA